MNQETLRQEVRAIVESGHSLTSIGQATGLASSTLSMWLAEKYKGDNDKVAKSVESFLQRMRERKQHPKKQIGFVQTSVAKRVFEVARLCHLDGEIGICYGEAGVGKTRAIAEYAAVNYDVILVEADLGYTAKVLFQELHRKLGMDGVGPINELKDAVIAKLKKSGRLIIVDEAEHLPYRALELLRRLNDKAGVGILLVGMPRLINNLRGKKGEYAQLYSRVGVASKLDALKPHDTEAIVRGVIPAGTHHKAYHEASLGNTRVLCKLLLRSLRVAEINKTGITAELIQETARMLII